MKKFPSHFLFAIAYFGSHLTATSACQRDGKTWVCFWHPGETPNPEFGQPITAQLTLHHDSQQVTADISGELPLVDEKCFYSLLGYCAANQMLTETFGLESNVEKYDFTNVIEYPNWHLEPA